MLNNWRNSLMLSRLAFRSDDNFIAMLAMPDIYKPVEYIALDSACLHGKTSVLQWAKENFGDFGFDFDKYSMLLWPSDDAIPASIVAQHINAAVPKLAAIKLISPALAHGLDEIAELSFGDDLNDNINSSDINIYF